MTDLSEPLGPSCVPTHSAHARFYRPPLPDGYVSRVRLRAQLEAGLNGRLLLVSAPAGFGKSSLASEFCEQLGEQWRHLWLSLSERDQEPGRFLERLLQGLRQFYPSVGEELLGILKMRQRHQPFAFEQWLDDVLDELSRHLHPEQRLLVVLDDYHLAQGPVLDRCLQFLLAHLPAGMTLLVTSRQRPDWHLARLRLSKQLLELTEQDLRLNETELAALLVAHGSIAEQAEQKQLLHRSEGWVAGLRLWLLARKSDDRALNLHGGEGLIRDYLLEEVIERQSVDVQQFLYQTAGLERFCAELCDAVRDSYDSAAIIAHLQANQVFLVPLDEQGRWFRYHHLFSDLLTTRGSETAGVSRSGAHLRACRWYAAQGQIEAAVEQALLAGQVDVAANLVQNLSEEQMLAEQNIAMLLRWKANLPDALLVSTPRLIMLYGWALALACQLEAAADLLSQLQRFLPAQDAKAQQSLLAQWQALDGFIARGRGDSARAVAQCEEAASALQGDRYGPYFMCLGTLGNVALACGDVQRARSLNRQALELAQRANNPMFEAVAYYERARVLQVRGEVLRALEQVRAGLDRIRSFSTQRHYSIRARLHIYEGYLLALSLQTEQALHCLVKGVNEAVACRDVAVLTGYCVMASIEGRQKRFTEAFNLLAEAERQMHLWDVPAVYYLGIITLIKCELWMRQGQLEHAALWMTQLEEAYRGGLAPEFHPQLLQHIELQMAVLEQRQGHALLAEQRLKRLLQQCQNHGLALVAMLAHSQLLQVQRQLGNEREARQLMDTAFAAARGGALLPFEDLLRHSSQWFSLYLNSRSPCWVRDVLLSQLPTAADAQLLEPEYLLTDKLSTRELAVLQLIARGCSNQQISEQLFISLHTVKTHARHINSKLNVERRTQAVARAKALGLLS